MRFPRYIAKHQKLRNKVALEIFTPLIGKLFDKTTSKTSDLNIKECKDAIIKASFSLADQFIRESKK